ncbi:hypothetical protein ACN47E_006086 [Coniothyrium glycines]
MATAEAASRPHDRHARKRPFAGWMKRLANLKPSSSETPSKKKAAAKNNPYPESGYVTTAPQRDRPSFSTTNTPPSNDSYTSVEESTLGQRQALAKSNKSTAPTVATVPDTLHSARSKADTGTSNFVNGGSTFSSPHGSEHSLTTTLTTIQSTAPSNVLNAAAHAATTPSGPPVHFSHQFPTSPPPSAIPPHLAPQQQQQQQQPNSYQGATANNILTDNASILTLASSSKRRRRNSVDTNASMRALAPSSHYGGSRESLPLSVLSANADAIYSPSARPNVSGLAAERASVYSASGVTAPVLPSERNSYYANKQADGLSVRSGLLGHGRTDSISSIRATPTSPLAPLGPGRIGRKSSEWRDAREASDEEDSPASPLRENEDHGKPKPTS